MRTPTTTAAEPIQNGACRLTFSPSLPASHGATAPPENRTNEYADDATDRSTGAAPMTACVITVLLIPRNAPATTTPMTSAVRESVQIAIAARSRANRVRLVSAVGTVPSLRSSQGATQTEVKASRIPHPKKTQPTWEAVMSSGNGVKASRVKNPML